jgi:hypothetical protein
MFTSESPAILGIPYIPWNVGDEAHDHNSTMTAALIRSQILFPLGLILVSYHYVKHSRLSAPLTMQICKKQLQISKPQLVSCLLLWIAVGRNTQGLSNSVCFGTVVRTSNLENEAMQEKVFDLIIVPLMENLRSFKD